MDPGFSKDTVLTFRGEGNQSPKLEAADLVIKFSQLKHAKFVRSGNNLIYTQDCTLVDALNMLPVQLQTLDKRCLTQCFDELVSPQTCRCVSGEGMPLVGGGKGDMYIRFNISIPSLSTSQRQQLVKALEANAAELM